MNLVIVNTETGEEQTLNNVQQGVLRPPWKIKEALPDPELTRGAAEFKAKVAVWATKLGLPLATFLDTTRWLLKKDCPFCQVGTQVLKRLDELGEDKARELVSRILVAKEANDLAALERIRAEMNG